MTFVFQFLVQFLRQKLVAINHSSIVLAQTMLLCPAATAFSVMWGEDEERGRREGSKRWGREAANQASNTD